MPQRPLRRLAAILLLAFSTALPAQVRSIPADAKRGEIRHLQAMQVEISGERVTLAPGVQIRDASNRLILPLALPSGAAVKYVLDTEGLPWRVWILTPEEIAARDPVR